MAQPPADQPDPPSVSGPAVQDTGSPSPAARPGLAPPGKPDGEVDTRPTAPAQPPL